MTRLKPGSSFSPAEMVNFYGNRSNFLYLNVICRFESNFTFAKIYNFPRTSLDVKRKVLKAMSSQKKNRYRKTLQCGSFLHGNIDSNAYENGIEIRIIIVFGSENKYFADNNLLGAEENTEFDLKKKNRSENILASSQRKFAHLFMHEISTREASQPQID